MLLAKSLKGKISSIANWRRPASGEASKPITCCSWHRGALANLQYCGDAGPLRFVAAELDADADRAGLFDAADRFTKPTLSDSVPQPFGGAMVVFGDCGIQPLYEVQLVAAMGEELADALAQLGGATLVDTLNPPELWMLENFEPKQ